MTNQQSELLIRQGGRFGGDAHSSLRVVRIDVESVVERSSANGSAAFSNGARREARHIQVRV
jgi:hypothetical protein